MILQRPSRGGPQRLLFGWRELAVVLVGLSAALALVLAARAPSQDPETIGRATLARESAAAAGAALAAWNELRVGDELLSGQPALLWPARLPEVLTPAHPRPAATTPEERACDALVGEARRLGALDQLEAFALLDEAASRVSGQERLAVIQLEALRVAVAHENGARARAAWSELARRTDGRLVEDEVALELLGCLAVAPLLSAAQRDEAVQLVARRWSDGSLALPAVRAPWPEDAAALDLRATLGEALLANASEALRATLRPLIARREALARGDALWQAARLPERVRTAEGFASLALTTAEPATGADRLLLVRPADDGLLEGALVLRATLASLLEDGVRARNLLSKGFELRLGADGSSTPDRDPGSGATRLPGTSLSFVVAHEDPDAYVARASGRAQWTQRALLALAAVVVLASLATARMLSRSRALLLARTAFVANVSHELRTPLATILLMAENLEEGRVTDAERKAHYHRSIRREAARLRRLVEDVLDLARSERGEAPELSPTLVELGPFAAELEDTLEQRAEARGGRIAFASSGLDGTAWLDPEAYTRAAANLVENAVVHGSAVQGAPTQRPVEVSFACNGDSELQLSVRDHGPGLSPSARARAFEPFARLDAKEESRPGAGLGLAIVREIARAHGGRVAFKTPPAGGGALVELSVPRREPVAPAPAPPTPPAPQRATPA